MSISKPYNGISVDPANYAGNHTYILCTTRIGLSAENFAKFPQDPSVKVQNAISLTEGKQQAFFLNSGNGWPHYQTATPTIFTI